MPTTATFASRARLNTSATERMLISIARSLGIIGKERRMDLVGAAAQAGRPSASQT